MKSLQQPCKVSIVIPILQMGRLRGSGLYEATKSVNGSSEIQTGEVLIHSDKSLNF